jgi:hypothetical protein
MSVDPERDESLSEDEQRAVVYDLLRRRDEIAQKTREQIADRSADSSLDPLAQVDPEVRQAAEEAYYLEQGKRRYRTSDGRTLYLTPEEIAQRRRVRSQRGTRGKRPRFYGPTGTDRRRWLLTWGFNAAAVLMGLAIVYVILR